MEQHRDVNCITKEMLKQYGQYLKEEEGSRATVEKYVRGMRKLGDYLHGCGEEGLDKESMSEYKQYLREHYKTTSVNPMLAAVNNFLEYIDRGECKMKLLGIQRVQFSDKEKESTEKDYARLAHMAERKGDIRVNMLLRTIGSTRIRINKLPLIIVESLETGRADIYNKGKFRITLLPAGLMKILKSYYRKMEIRSGSILIARNGKLTDRSNISKRMKLLGRGTGVDASKVFPHNFQHLFARIFYSIEEDVVRLVDLLEHSGINTTRIHTMNTEGRPRRQVSRVRLVLG